MATDVIRKLTRIVNINEAPLAKIILLYFDLHHVLHFVSLQNVKFLSARISKD